MANYYYYFLFSSEKGLHCKTCYKASGKSVDRMETGLRPEKMQDDHSRRHTDIQPQGQSFIIKMLNVFSKLDFIAGSVWWAVHVKHVNWTDMTLVWPWCTQLM